MDDLHHGHEYRPRLADVEVVDVREGWADGPYTIVSVDGEGVVSGLYLIRA